MIPLCGMTETGFFLAEVEELSVVVMIPVMANGWKLNHNEFSFLFPNLCVCLCLIGAIFIRWGRMKSYWESWRTWTHGSGEKICRCMMLFIYLVVIFCCMNNPLFFYLLSMSALNTGLFYSLYLIFYTIHSQYCIKLYATYLVPFTVWMGIFVDLCHLWHH